MVLWKEKEEHKRSREYDTDTLDLVYNSRKRGGDSADRYFKATELIAGVKDMRFQAIMPDTLHWLGVKKIDNMISMVSPLSLRLLTVRGKEGCADRLVGYEV